MSKLRRTNPKESDPTLQTRDGRAGPALSFARGAGIPERVTEGTWRSDMTRVLKRLAQASRSFRRKPDWAGYQVVVDRMAQVRTVLNVMSELGLYLSGVTGPTQDGARIWGEKQESQALEQVRSVVGSWIQDQTHIPGANQERAQGEWLCWRGVIATPAEDAIRGRVNKDSDRTLLVVPSLSASVHESNLLAQSQRRALRAGARGYAFLRTDDGLDDILGLEPNERVRATLWQARQDSVPSNEQVRAMAQARRDTARSSGYASAAALAQVQPIMNPKRMASALMKALTAVAPLVQIQEAALIKKGLSRWGRDRSDTGPRSQPARKVANDVWVLQGRKAAYPGTRVRETKRADVAFDDARWANRPWNTKFLSWLGTDGSLPLFPRAFPAERVRRTVMADLLSIGGWSVVRADRVGRAPWTLWRYQLIRRTNRGAVERAWVVVAPQQPRVHNASDASYAAYANMLRTRRAARPGVKGIDPVALVSLPFAWTEDRCVGSLQEMVHLAHEMGHILHFLELPGTGARENERMAGTLTEYPSVLMEQYASAPDVLRRWSNPRGNPAMRRLAYWRRRVVEQNRLTGFAQELEIGVVDLALHGRSRNPDAVVRRIRARAGLSPLHARDASGRASFDFNILGGLAYCYAACRALAVQRVGFIPQGAAVIAEVQTYLKQIAPGSAQPTFAQQWAACYGRSPDQDTERALARHARRLLKREQTRGR